MLRSVRRGRGVGVVVVGGGEDVEEEGVGRAERVAGGLDVKCREGRLRHRSYTRGRSEITGKQHRELQHGCGVSLLPSIDGNQASFVPVQKGGAGRRLFSAGTPSFKRGNAILLTEAPFWMFAAGCFVSYSRPCRCRPRARYVGFGTSLRLRPRFRYPTEKQSLFRYLRCWHSSCSCEFLQGYRLLGERTAKTSSVRINAARR